MSARARIFWTKICGPGSTSSKSCRCASRGARDTPKDAQSPILSRETRALETPARHRREPDTKRGSAVSFLFILPVELTISPTVGQSGNVRRKRNETDKPTFRAQTLLDRNKALIYEINKNHEARVAGGMERNVDLLRELNSNVAKAQELYEEAGGGFEFRQAEEGLDEAERRA